jgi:hypothetical protein
MKVFPNSTALAFAEAGKVAWFPVEFEAAPFVDPPLVGQDI